MTSRPRTPEADAACAAADWAVRHVVRRALDLAGLPDQARFVRNLPAVTNQNAARQADAALIGIIDRHHINTHPLRTVVGAAATACVHASYGSAEAAGAAADACATAAVALGVDDDQVRFVAHGGQADLVRSIWGLLDLD